MGIRLRRNSGFSLLEILIALIIVGILAFVATKFFSRSVEKSKSVEAYVYTGTIKSGEEFHKHLTGEYVALDSTEEINERLSVGIKPKYYDFRVILPEKDKFLIIAQRIGEDIEAALAQGEVPSDPTIIVMSESGLVKSGYEAYLGKGSADKKGQTSAGGGSSGSSDGGGGGGGFGGGFGGGGLSGGGGFGGGSGGSGGSSGGSGGSSGGSGDTGGTGGGSTGGGGAGSIPPGQTIATDIATALSLLNGSGAGQYFYDLINKKEISVIFDDFSKYQGASGALAFWIGPQNNTIYINDQLNGTMGNEALAAVIAHEATHADYAYNPEANITTTLQRHPELFRSDISIDRDNAGNEILYSVYDPETDVYKSQVFINNSIDQEYTSFSHALDVWVEIRGTQTDIYLDTDLALYQQGEADFKSNLRTRGSYSTLPEY